MYGHITAGIHTCGLVYTLPFLYLLFPFFPSFLSLCVYPLISISLLSIISLL